MDTIMEKPAATADLENILRQLARPARWHAPRQDSAKGEIARLIQQQPDITLGEVRGTLLGTGFTWSPDGKLAYVPAHVELIEEVEAQIEFHGWGARAADLFS